ncbi:hypothetical protein LCGC14_1907280 [marine sediment metagenome]|uniref:Uncharacterized protein n=1 Tax=marine sediment metagenome TaxID=412755 RepID=A0A0F9I8N0_9ZZZZ
MKRLLTALLAIALTAVASLPASAAPERVTLCHFGETKQVPKRAVSGHLGHGDYLGECQEPDPDPDPEPAPAPPSSAQPLYKMWLLTRDKQVLVGRWKDTLTFPGYWQCLIISETHPSEERQRNLCFRGQYPSNYNSARLRHLADEDRRLGGWWVADNTPCAAAVYDDGSWYCNKFTIWGTR